MIKNGKGGGNTKTGLIFEGETDLATFLSKQPSYSVDDGLYITRAKKSQGYSRNMDFINFLQKKALIGRK